MIKIIQKLIDFLKSIKNCIVKSRKIDLEEDEVNNSI